MLEKQNRGLCTASSTLGNDTSPVTDTLHAGIIKHEPDIVWHKDKCQVMLSIVAHHAAYVVDVLVLWHVQVHITQVELLQNQQVLSGRKRSQFAALQYSHKCIRIICIYGYIAAGIAQAPKQMVMHACIGINAQHVRQSTCVMPSIACLISLALSLLLCHASCMVNTRGGVLRRMCCTAFSTLHPPAEHKKLHVDDQDERKLVNSQTVPDRHQWHGSLWYLHVCKEHSITQACNCHNTAIGGAMVPLSVSQDFWLWFSMSLRA